MRLNRRKIEVAKYIISSPDCSSYIIIELNSAKTNIAKMVIEFVHNSDSKTLIVLAGINAPYFCIRIGLEKTVCYFFFFVLNFFDIAARCKLQ